MRRDGDGWTFEGLADLGRLVGDSVTIGGAGSGEAPTVTGVFTVEFKGRVSDKHNLGRVAALSVVRS